MPVPAAWVTPPRCAESTWEQSCAMCTAPLNTTPCGSDCKLGMPASWLTCPLPPCHLPLVQYTVNNQMVNATLMNIADNPTNVQLPGVC